MRRAKDSSLRKTEYHSTGQESNTSPSACPTTRYEDLGRCDVKCQVDTDHKKKSLKRVKYNFGVRVDVTLVPHHLFLTAQSEETEHENSPRKASKLVGTGEMSLPRPTNQCDDTSHCLRYYHTVTLLS